MCDMIVTVHTLAYCRSPSALRAVGLENLIQTNNDFLLVCAKLKSTYQTLEVSSLYSSSSSLLACLAWAVFAGYGRFARE